MSKKINGYSNYGKQAAKERKRKESQDRLESWRKLSPQQQLDALDARLGKGVGATKQREKLNAKLSEETK